MRQNPWSKEEGHQRWLQSKKTGHTQLLLKCGNCGLEFIILTWRTDAELQSDFGLTGDIEPRKELEDKDRSGKHRSVLTFAAPGATQLTCPECASGEIALLNYRRAKGAICDATRK